MEQRFQPWSTETNLCSRLGEYMVCPNNIGDREYLLQLQTTFVLLYALILQQVKEALVFLPLCESLDGLRPKKEVDIQGISGKAMLRFLC